MINKKYLLDIMRIICIGIIINLICLFLMECINADSKLSSMQYIFVWSYFIAVQLALGLWYKKTCNHIKTSGTNKVIIISTSVVLALTFLFLSPSFLIPNYSAAVKVGITATGEPGKSDDLSTKEVWLLDIMIDGTPYDLSQIELEGNWVYREGAILCAGNEPSTLTMTLPYSKDIEFELLRHPWSGFAVLEYNNVKDTINLYQEEDSEREKISIEVTNISLPPWQIAAGLGGILLYTFIFGFILQIGCRKNKLRETAFCLVSVLLLFSTKQNTTDENMYIVAVFTFVPSVIWALLSSQNICSKKHKKTFYVLFEFCTFYFTFALFANSFFLTELTVTITVERVVFFLLAFMAMHPAGHLLLLIFDRIQAVAANRAPNTNKKAVLKVSLVCTAIIFTLLFFISLGFYPACMSPDGATHWQQALGVTRITDDSPAAYTLFVRLCSLIAPTPFSYTIIQLLFFSGVFGAFLGFLYQKGVTKKVLIFFSVLLAFLPNNYMTLMLLSKNPMFSILNIGVMYLLIRLLDDPYKFCHSFFMMFQFSTIVAALGLVRHNSSFALAAIIIIAVYFTVRYFQQTKVILLCALAASFVLIGIVKGPVYQQFDVQESHSTVYGPLVSPLAAAVKSNKQLPEDITRAMEQILPLEEWGDRYIPYNRDRFTWTNPRPDYSETSLKQIFIIYLRLLFIHPDTVIKDRLDNMETLWNILPSRGNGAYNSKYIAGIHQVLNKELLPTHLKNEEPNSLDLYFKENLFSTIPLMFAEISTENQWLDLIVWRTGIYIVIFLYLCLFLYSTKNLERLFVALPSFATLLTLVLFIGYQLYQYMWFFPLAMFMFTSYVLLLPSAKGLQKSKEGE